MFQRSGVVLSLAVVLASWALLIQPTPACCPVSSGKPVVNADQTVILIWDAATQTERFIREARPGHPSQTRRLRWKPIPQQHARHPARLELARTRATVACANLAHDFRSKPCPIAKTHLQ
ncbi:MAG TPA: hypothetical protein VK395_31120 [Gemmataceae bacterium]|nr:hypothetical protein [Gemmataceae bacterium]